MSARKASASYVASVKLLTYQRRGWVLSLGQTQFGKSVIASSDAALGGNWLSLLTWHLWRWAN